MSAAEKHKYDLIYDRGGRKYELVNEQGRSKATTLSMDNILQAYQLSQRLEAVLESAKADDSIHIRFRTMEDRTQFMKKFRQQVGRRSTTLGQ